VKKSQVVTALIVVAFIGILIGINSVEPSRVSEQQMEESLEAQRQIEEAEKVETSVSERLAQAARSAESATSEPESTEPFQVAFECSNGTFVIEVYPEWAPIGAARFREVVEAGIWDEARFFRVLPGFVVQWGIPGDPELAKEWGEKTIKGEPVKTSNDRGTITYAMLSGDLDSRTTQVYVNLVDNAQRLDHLGFAPFGKVISGMEVVDAINSEYKQEPDQSLIESRGNAYLKEYFPNLDYIKHARIIESADGESEAE
jgi:cyclophilin family peptidyl-prolyl cis-trans isomerase